MKNLYLLICCCLVFTATSAQQAQRLRKNAVYLEAGGNALFYSLNYDRLIPLAPRVKLAARLGVSYLPYDGSNKLKHFIIPMEVNVLYAKQPESKNFAEGGVGLTLFEFVKGFRYGDRKQPVTQLSNITLVRVGFRHQKATGGLMYRAGVLVPVTQDEFSKNKVGDDIFYRIAIGFGIGLVF